jgi:hypothetical protein
MDGKSFVARMLLDGRGFISYGDLKDYPFELDEEEAISYMEAMDLVPKMAQLKFGPFVVWDIIWKEKP